MLKTLTILLLTSEFLFGAGAFSLVKPMAINSKEIILNNTDKLGIIGNHLKEINSNYTNSTSKFLQSKNSYTKEVLKHEAINNVLLENLSMELEKYAQMKVKIK